MTPLSDLRVLVVEDDADTRSNLCDVLELDDYRIDTAATATEALARRDWDQIDAIILDRKLPDGTAEELLPRLKRLAPHAAVIIVTGYADLEGAIAAVRQGAADYLLKPVNLDLLRARLAGIAQHKQAQETIANLNLDLQRHMTDLSTLLNVIPIGIAITEDPQGQTLRINPALSRLWRLPHGSGAALSPLPLARVDFKMCQDGKEMPRDQLPLQRAAVQGVDVRDAEVDIVFPDGTTTKLLVYAAPLLDEEGQSRGAVGAFLDITERKKAQERLLQTERLAAIGQMMTGLAHESGNALARSQACLEMLGLEVEDRPEAVNLVARIQHAQDHLQQLYEEVRGYAAPLNLQREPISLQDIWRMAWTTLELSRRGRDVSLVEETQDLDLVCDVDIFRIQQVFRNILDNALAACRDPVRITVHCTAVTCNDRPAIRVAVRDNGPGLSAEQRRRIFEPFFTTKSKGTGLGMAIASRIVEAHGGQLAVGDSRTGAEILVTLPRHST
jgi:signal transduction histidine kinase/FixJ family two-component response regulator